jgi:hypothetical protein
MRRAGVPLAVLTAGLVWSGSGLAADTEVPAITNLKAKPSTFCAKRTQRCTHPGTEIQFTVSTAARVRADIRPRSVNRGPLVEFSKHFPRGHNSVYVKDSRLTPQRWTLRLQGGNSVGNGPIAITDVRVVKR